jgi:hypothetical protein
MNRVYGIALPGLAVTSQGGQDFLVEIGSLKLYFYREEARFFSRWREGDAHVFATGRCRVSVEWCGAPVKRSVTDSVEVATA